MRPYFVREQRTKYRICAANTKITITQDCCHQKSAPVSFASLLMSLDAFLDISRLVILVRVIVLIGSQPFRYGYSRGSSVLITETPGKGRGTPPIDIRNCIHLIIHSIIFRTTYLTNSFVTYSNIR